MDIPPIDDSYRLRAVYKVILDQAELFGQYSPGQEYFFPKISIPINKDQNFVLVSFQSVTTLVMGLNYSDYIGFNYELKVDNNTPMKSPIGMISRTAFNSSTKNNSYQFVINNLSIGSHVVGLSIKRLNSTGDAYYRSLFVNQEHPINANVERKGLMLVYVYEK